MTAMVQDCLNNKSWSSTSQLKQEKLLEADGNSQRWKLHKTAAGKWNGTTQHDTRKSGSTQSLTVPCVKSTSVHRCIVTSGALLVNSGAEVTPRSGLSPLSERQALTHSQVRPPNIVSHVSLVSPSIFNGCLLLPHSDARGKRLSGIKSEAMCSHAAHSCTPIIA